MSKADLKFLITLVLIAPHLNIWLAIGIAGLICLWG